MWDRIHTQAEQTFRCGLWVCAPRLQRLLTEEAQTRSPSPHLLLGCLHPNAAVNNWWADAGVYLPRSALLRRRMWSEDQNAQDRVKFRLTKNMDKTVQSGSADACAWQWTCWLHMWRVLLCTHTQTGINKHPETKAQILSLYIICVSVCDWEYLISHHHLPIKTLLLLLLLFIIPLPSWQVGTQRVVGKFNPKL